VYPIDGCARAQADSGEKWQTRGFKRVKERLNLDLDFGRKTWPATINNQASQKLLALRWGGTRTTLDVRGMPWYNQELAVVNLTANLTLHN